MSSPHGAAGGGARSSDDGPPLFSRIVCGISGSERSVDAAAQASRLLPDDGELLLLAVADLAKTSHAGWGASNAARHLLESLDEALIDARAAAGAGTGRMLHGRPEQTLLAMVDQQSATLLAIGAPGHRRLAGLALGAVGSALVRESPCPVLLARPQREKSAGFARIVVGVDGSAEPVFAASVAGRLAQRFGSQLDLVAGLGGKPIDQALVDELHPGVSFDSQAPVDALVDASGAADLVVVGSRGLHGLAALGSVSERVAHRADASVLLIRSAAKPAQAV